MSDPRYLRQALLVAFRHIDAPTTTPSEREAILVAMAEGLHGDEAELASRILHHMRESAALQLLLWEKARN